LVVGIVVDQMRADYLYRFANHYGEDGLKLLMKEGANFQNCHYNYVPTFTGPGHASIYTGTTPANHGIVANAWWSREEGKRVNCVEDQQSKPVGSSPDTKGNYSPMRLKSNTITDQIKLMDSRSKVYSISIKNRGAILPGGHAPDGVFWYDYANGWAS
jgi:predicted AlkP superfamily pyrophosphatase or phosphodiesterase